jgi:4-hydroxy-tetrahydrodipicolinate reductase
MAAPAKLVIHGAAGRMGRRLVALADLHPDLTLVAAVDSPDSPHQGEDAGELAGIGRRSVPITDQIPDSADVVIDFSVPQASISAATVCAARGIPIVVATTGFSHEEREQLQTCSHKTAVLWSPSMSLAVNLTMKLSAIAAEAFKDHPGGVDVEILERHHRHKEDAPSGTALKFGEIIAKGMNLSRHVHGREGRPGARTREEIGYHAIRTGDNPGEHTILFGMNGESLELTVKASNRDCYAQGALAAAAWLVGKGAGMYSMNDVLGF